MRNVVKSLQKLALTFAEKAVNSLNKSSEQLISERKEDISLARQGKALTPPAAPEAIFFHREIFNIPPTRAQTIIDDCKRVIESTIAGIEGRNKWLSNLKKNGAGPQPGTF